jgi:hypothetical protein
MKFFETSAKSSHNVEEAFMTMAKEIVKELKEKEKNSNLKIMNSENYLSGRSKSLKKSGCQFNKKE